MDEKLMETYMDKLDELLIDEDKIVTYKSLSKSLGLHVNTAKQLLHTYLSKKKSKNLPPISATYFLAGKLKDGSINISVVNEEDLKSVSSKFIKITSEHVYSIHKGKNIKEVKVLCEIDKESPNVERPAVIKCSKSVLKFVREVQKKTSTIADDNKKIIENAMGPTLVETNKNTDSCSSKETKISPIKTSPKQSLKGSSTKNQTDSKKLMGNIANLFAKATQKKAEKSLKNEKIDLKSTQEQEKTEPLNDSTNAEPNAKEVSVKTERKSFGKSDQLKEEKKKKNGSKRKRIQMLCDSEDSESDNGKETSPVKEASPLSFVENIEEVMEEPKETFLQNKRKRRKVVDRTIMNEDGYLETKKEVVFETDSEGELEEQEKKTNNEQKKARFPSVGDKGRGLQSSSAAKKQSSLLNFFKKS